MSAKRIPTAYVAPVFDGNAEWPVRQEAVGIIKRIENFLAANGFRALHFGAEDSPFNSFTDYSPITRFIKAADVVVLPGGNGLKSPLAVLTDEEKTSHTAIAINAREAISKNRRRKRRRLQARLSRQMSKAKIFKAEVF